MADHDTVLVSAGRGITAGCVPHCLVCSGIIADHDTVLISAGRGITAGCVPLFWSVVESLWATVYLTL